MSPTPADTPPPDPAPSASGDTAWMLVSREEDRWTAIDAGKVSAGRFHTRSAVWLTPQVRAFLRRASPRTIVDPFAGAGDILDAVEAQGFGERARVGYDVSPDTPWIVNDSLLSIPPRPHAAVVTNPPYLARHSAKRKRVYARVARYFEAHPDRSDLYQIALDRCLEAARHVVAIVPETFVNSRYRPPRLHSVTILEESPFEDTECPVCVVCFDGREKDDEAVRVYKGRRALGTLAAFERLRLRPRRDVVIRFNDPDGRLALRAVDLPDPEKPIAFLRREQLAYDRARIKVSSRLVTFLEIPSLCASDLDAVVARANRRLARFRRETADVVLSPFKGNTKDGVRRRRLDYATARAILERAVADVTR